MQSMQQMTYAAKGLAGLAAGWVFGFGLMLGASIMGAYMNVRTLEMPDRALLGGMLLATGMLAAVLVSAGLAEMCLGDRAAAEADFRHSLELNPNQPMLQRFLRPD